MDSELTTRHYGLRRKSYSPLEGTRASARADKLKHMMVGMTSRRVLRVPVLRAAAVHYET